MQTEWKAIYNDGTALSQYNEDGSENKYPDIERAKLVQFIILRDNEPKVVIHLDKKKKLIYRLRGARGNKGYEETVYLAGWQEKRNGINIQMIAFLFEDGHIEIVDRFNEKHDWMYSIIFREDEKV